MRREVQGRSVSLLLLTVLCVTSLPQVTSTKFTVDPGGLDLGGVGTHCSGCGQFACKTLQCAVKLAGADDDRIHIRRGVYGGQYNGDLVVDHPIHIVGEENVFIQYSSTSVRPLPVFTFKGARVTSNSVLANVTIQFAEHSAIVVEEGASPVISNVQVHRSRVQPAVVISGVGTFPHISDSVFSQNGDEASTSVILVNSGASLSLERSAVDNNQAQRGVHVITGRNWPVVPTNASDSSNVSSIVQITRTSVNGNGQNGIDIATEYFPLFAYLEDVDVSGNGFISPTDAIRIASSSTPPNITLSRVRVTNNVVTYAGVNTLAGAPVNLRIINSTISNNKAGVGVKHSSGGCLDLAHSAITLNDNLVTSEILIRNGGGLSVSGCAHLRNVQVSQNRGTFGGGIYVGQGNSHVTMVDCVLFDNEAATQGSAVHAECASGSTCFLQLSGTAVSYNLVDSNDNSNTAVVFAGTNADVVLDGVDVACDNDPPRLGCAVTNSSLVRDGSASCNIHTCMQSLWYVYAAAAVGLGICLMGCVYKNKLSNAKSKISSTVSWGSYETTDPRVLRVRHAKGTLDSPLVIPVAEDSRIHPEQSLLAS